MKKSMKKGFTLVELIVVIAILGILALLIVPQVSGYTKEARRNTAAANVKACYSSLQVNQAATEANMSATPVDGKCAPTELAADTTKITYTADAQCVATLDIATGIVSFTGTLCE